MSVWRWLSRLFVLVTGVACFFSTSVRAQDLGNVGRFDMAEYTFTSNNSYANKFTQVTLTARVTQPEGGTIVVRGFHDGGNTWKLRIMPRTLGEYTLTTSSNDPQLNGQTGSFACINSTLKGPIRQHVANPYAFMHEDGTPFLWTGDWYSPFLSPAMAGLQNSTVDVLVTNKVNSLKLNLVGIGGDEPNLHVYPWTGTKLSLNLTRFDVAKLAQWDQAIAYMKEKGIVANLFFYSDSNTNLYPAAGSANEDLLFQYLTARYAAYWNVTWNLALEYSEYRNASWVRSRAQFVKNEDPYDKLLAVHQLPPATTNPPTPPSYDFRGDPNLDHTALQANEVEAKLLNASIINTRSATQSAGRAIPVMIQEFYFDTRPTSLATGRQSTWSMLTGGAAGYNLGKLQVMEDPNWQNRPHLSITSVLNPFVTANTRFWHMEPANNRVASGKFCGAMLTGGPPQFLVFSPSGGSFDVSLSGTTGTFSALWLDPTRNETGFETDVTGGGTTRFTNPFGTGEVVLLLRQTQSETTLPTLSIISPADGATVSGTIQVDGTASDSSGIARVEYQIDSWDWRLATGTSSWNFLLDTTLLSNGSHTISVRATDGASPPNTSSDLSRTVSVSNGFDTTPPTLSINSPTEGAEVSGTTLVTGAASDDSSGVDRVEYQIDSTEGAWTLASGKTTWSFQWNTATHSVGSHTIWVRAADGASPANNSAPVARSVIIRRVNQVPVANDRSVTTPMTARWISR